ncbi:hypothetical protein GCM10017559_07820 [Streptosporangium longisporum]|uniref:Uncharacterized protein n=1 Tax=Streptosporangium longisporum TaxID=46187 RepID=A0ABP6K848_9ACTN
MSDFPITLRLPLAMLDQLVPEGSTLPQAWVVLLASRAQTSTTPDGRPVYGPISGWSPVLPVAYQGEAITTAMRLAEASLGGEPDQWRWYPATDDDTLPLTELFAIVDGDEVCPEVAIAPLTVLLRDEPQDGGRA